LALPLLSQIETGAFARIGFTEYGIVYASLTMMGKGLAERSSRGIHPRTAELKSLHHLRQLRTRDFKPKAGASRRTPWL
jgi:hypothetical protein